MQDANGDGAAASVDTADTVHDTGPGAGADAAAQALFNLLAVTRGKTVPSEVLGSGNCRDPRPGLHAAERAGHLSAGRRLGLGRQLQQHGQGLGQRLQWPEVRSFYGQPADAQVFLTREDEQGKTHVVFNGRAADRGQQHRGQLPLRRRRPAPAPGSLTVVLQPQPGLAAIVNPVAPAAAPTPTRPTKIRKLAPLSVLTFGRAVSLDDFQTIAGSAPGVTRAAAAYRVRSGVAAARVTVWVGDDEGAVAAAQNAFAAAADPNRQPLVKLATQRHDDPVADLSCAIPRYQDGTVQAALHTRCSIPTPACSASTSSASARSSTTARSTRRAWPSPASGDPRSELRGHAPRFASLTSLRRPQPDRDRSAAVRPKPMFGGRPDLHRRAPRPGAGRLSTRFRRPTFTWLEARIMTDVPDHYGVYYADKLWNLLPAVYRAQDTDQFDTNGPLRELVNRIGAQAANVRRNIDRMWEDQSIETCDDWVIPYIGDLLAPIWCPSSMPRAQRLDVAKTIYYRRRKGTLAILEEIASEITGWDAKVVEFFRRLGRTRHGLDPAIGASLLGDGDVAPLQQAEGLVGPLTRTGIGGFADLRNVYGASKAGTAFDEYFHTADLRKPHGSIGWYNIPAARRLPLAAQELRRRAGHAGSRPRLPRLVHLRPDRPRRAAVCRGARQR